MAVRERHAGARRSGFGPICASCWLLLAVGACLNPLPDDFPNSASEEGSAEVPADSEPVPGQGLDDVDDGHRQLRPQLAEAGRRGGVARHDHGLRAVVLDEAPRQLVGVAAHLVERLAAVRVAAGVADVHEVLGGQQIDDRPGDGEPAEPGVEHADRPIHAGAGYGRIARRMGHGRSGPRMVRGRDEHT